MKKESIPGTASSTCTGRNVKKYCPGEKDEELDIFRGEARMVEQEEAQMILSVDFRSYFKVVSNAKPNILCHHHIYFFNEFECQVTSVVSNSL